jgi:hypothetical protein
MRQQLHMLSLVVGSLAVNAKHFIKIPLHSRTLLCVSVSAISRGGLLSAHGGSLMNNQGLRANGSPKSATDMFCEASCDG